MSLFVACNSCGARFPVDSHAGLLRCTPCEVRLEFRLTGRGPLVVEIADSEVAA